MIRYFFGAFFLSCAVILTYGQTADFNAQISACSSENIQLVNTSSGASNYEWDFCQGDLQLSPVLSPLNRVGGATIEGIDIVSDGINWLGFVASRDDNSIIRLDFGQDLNSTPTILNLGNVGGILNGPTDIRIIRDGLNWYGFVYNTFGNFISRVDFGNSLLNTSSSPIPITAQAVLSGTGNGDGGFDVKYTNGKYYIFYTNGGSAGMIRLNTITSVPTTADIISYPVSGITYMPDCKLVQSNGKWFGYAVSSIGAKTIQRFDFGTDIFSIPSTADITGSALGSLTPYGLDLAFDNGENALFISSLEGGLTYINLGKDLSQPPVSSTALGNFNVMANTLTFKIIKEQSNWHAFTIAWNTGQLYRLSFPNPACAGSIKFSKATSPEISYNTPGENYISLRSYTGLNYDETTKSITISAQVAPDISFSFQNICASNATSITSTSTATITNYTWDFGDGGTLTGTVPGTGHTYGAAGPYVLSLSVAGANGCSNFLQDTLRIYNAPVADFTIPNPSITCTNQHYTFSNTSTADPGSAPFWQWKVNGSPVSSSKDLNLDFPAVADESIQLVASIPGCSTQKTQTFDVQQQGPLVDFTASNGCQGKALNFTNNSTGNITGYDWSFGDGNVSVSPVPQHAYTDIGTYTVTLTANNPLGCNNSMVKQLTIFSTPQPSFLLELPPFSCSGTPSQFSDTTPNPTDSNLSGWNWTFGDTANGTASIQNPVYIYPVAASYTVSLDVTTDMNCSASVQQQVTIAPSPTAAFTYSPACVNQPTVFTDASEPGIKSWVWKLGANTFNIQNPTNSFSTSASYTAELTVTSSNNCVSKITKTVVVPDAQTPDFTVAKACSGMAVEFFNTTPATTDVTKSVLWDFDEKGTSNDNQPEFSFSDAGNANVTLTTTTASGCSYSNLKVIHISKTPVAAYTLAPNGGVVPALVKFTNTSSDASRYEWNFNDPSLTKSSSTSPSFNFATAGDFPVELIAFGESDCMDTITQTVHITVQHGPGAFFDIYPNPCDGEFHLDWTSSTAGTADLLIMGVVGEKVLELNQISYVQGLNQTVVDVSKVYPGMYEVVFSGMGFRKYFRLIINR